MWIEGKIPAVGPSLGHTRRTHSWDHGLYWPALAVLIPKSDDPCVTREGLLCRNLGDIVH